MKETDYLVVEPSINILKLFLGAKDHRPWDDEELPTFPKGEMIGLVTVSRFFKKEKKNGNTQSNFWRRKWESR